jgi:mannose-6-phosphate isomerase-like protein (cupin superfamily)
MLLAILLLGSGVNCGGGTDSHEVTGLAELTRRAPELHDTHVLVEGCVSWAGCGEGTCLLELVDEGAPALLVRYHGQLDVTAVVGRTARATGLFFQKVYPRYRMEPWQALGWHAGEPLPVTAQLVRMDASELVITDTKPARCPAPGTIEPWIGPVFDLAVSEFETGGTGTGRKCLEPGGVTPPHSTWGSQELLFGLEGTVQVTIEGVAPFELGPGRGAYVPPHTEHALSNTGQVPACYLFVYSRPAEDG